MQIGSLVKHIEYGYIGITTKHYPTVDKWLIHFTDGVIRERWCSECELELICK